MIRLIFTIFLFNCLFIDFIDYWYLGGLFGDLDALLEEEQLALNQGIR